MEKFELTASELMNTLNWKKSKVYYWINSGKFETIERETGINVLITDEQIKRLKTETFQESFKEYKNSFENSEEVQENQVQNVTKHYETVSNIPVGLDNKFYNDALLTMKEMYQTFVQSQSYNMKLLTDGKSEIETELFELRAENKELSQKVLKSTKSETLKNCVIAVISILFVISLAAVMFLSNSLIKFQTVSKTETVENVQTNQNFSQPPVQVQSVKNHNQKAKSRKVN